MHIYISQGPLVFCRSPVWSILLKKEQYSNRSSNAMPRAVKSAILFCLTSQGTMTEERGKRYLEVMEQEGRLCEECWS